MINIKNGGRCYIGQVYRFNWNEVWQIKSKGDSYMILESMWQRYKILIFLKKVY